MKSETQGRSKIVRIGKKPESSMAVLKLLGEVRAYVAAHPEAESMVVMVGSPGHCKPFTTPIDRPLDFIGMLELMKHDLFREK